MLEGAAAPASFAYGPRIPDFREATSALTEGELTQERVQGMFRPTPAISEWIESFCGRFHPEGPRTETAEFWLQRPSGNACVSP